MSVFRFSKKPQEVFAGFRSTLSPTQQGALDPALVMLADLHREIEDWVNGVHRQAWDKPGVLDDTLSPPYKFRAGAVLKEVEVLMGTPGTSNSVLTLYKNAVSIGTVTYDWDAGTPQLTFFDVAFGPADLLTMKFTTLGTDAADGTVILEAA